jgi:hypothetical protein
MDGGQGMPDTAPGSGQFLPFVVAADGAEDEDTLGLFPHGEGKYLLREIPAEIFKASLTRTISMLSSVLSQVADDALGMPLQEVQIGVEVTGSGGIQLIGTAQAGTTGAITLVFRRA